MLEAAALSFAFFLSGAAGLIFQIVWFHRAGLALGSSLWAVTVVLSSFMAGLALGNLLAGRFAGRIRRPLTTYAALEVIVAVSGIAATALLPLLTRIIGPLAAAISADGAGVHAVRFACAFVVLAVPATAMGATLPVLVGALASRQGSFGTVLGRFYGWNTLGAVVGVVAAEILLITTLGVWRTSLTAAFLDLTAAAIVFALTRAVSSAATDDAWRPVPEAGPRGTATTASARGDLRAMLACAFLAGGTLLALEVVWFRFLTMYVLSTTLAASLMLAVVLAAIGLGGLAASWWIGTGRPSGALVPEIAFASGCTVIITYAGFQILTGGTQVGQWSRVLWFASVLTFPTAFLSGMLFPLIGDALPRERLGDTKAVAWLALANTAGALSGPPIAAFILLPRLGMEGAFFTFAIVYGALALIAAVSRGTMRGRRTGTFAGAIALAVALGVFPFGTMRDRYFLRAAQAYAGDGSRILATREGPSETLFVMQQQWLGKPVYSRLVTNGFSMSGTTIPAMRYMRYFAYWPMLLHQGPLEHALVICYGVGVTAGAVTSIPSLTTIDVAEISADVVAMSDVIYAPAQHPLRDPRVRLHLEDGRYFLETTKERFDLITGEPPPPRTPGAANIYSLEYFQLIRDRLAEGGMATYWVPVARPDPGTDVDTIVRAFCEVFEDCSLWNATPFDLMLAGSRNARGPVTEAQFAAAWQNPTLQARLREVGFEQPEQIGATFVGDADYVRRLTAGTPPLTDDFPHRLIPVAGRASLSDPRYGTDAAVAARYQSVFDPSRARDAFRASPLVRDLWPNALAERSLPLFDRQRVINRVIWEGGKPLAQIEDLDSVLTGSALRTLPLWILGSDEVKQQIAESVNDGTGTTEYARGLRALTGRDYTGAAALFERAQARGLKGPTIEPLRAYALCRAGKTEAAATLARTARPSTDEERHFWTWMNQHCE